VRYQCGPPLIAPTYCHCASCRRAAGAHAVAWITVARPTLRFVQGESAQYRSSAKVMRGFCARCGTPLTYWHELRAQTIDITACTLDQPQLLRPVDHIWMEDALAWDRPADGLPQFAKTRTA
jgi:hypothetical protein